MSTPDQLNRTDAALRFSNQVVAILGMGLMGSSLALAIRSHCRKVIGIDPDPIVVDYVSGRDMVTEAWTDPAGKLDEATLVILAAPVGKILELITRLPDLHNGQAVVLDLGSTKSEIVKMMKQLPSRFQPLGGHPMCGKELLGPSQADGSLFKDAPFVLCPLNSTTEATRQITLDLISLIGAHPVILDPETHDHWVASTSHVPFLVANALAAVTPLKASPLARTGWQSTTRLAYTPTSMMMDVLRTNREDILASLGAVQEQLKQIEKHLSSEEYESLEAELDQGTRQYIEILSRGK